MLHNGKLVTFARMQNQKNVRWYCCHCHDATGAEHSAINLATGFKCVGNAQ